MSERRAESAFGDLRAAHLLRLIGYLDMAMLSMWTSNPRAQLILGMAEASLRGRGPGGADEDLLKRMRALVAEARDHLDLEDFPAAMARMRVAYDLAGLRMIELVGE